MLLVFSPNQAKLPLAHPGRPVDPKFVTAKSSLIDLALNRPDVPAD
jgi:hypothetical protein